ncbi:serine acetyltransferase [Paraburkholderia phymatum]|uniref:Serine acetyltransferase n=1 Tax=Paraburkholderia phymatum (strain DSM 17167 / CIP 108236 / LMG 21445 / STM815) TaxID=391038 RepID=B2JS50_PARP8|nr:serine acetyltransferase [Paraburkholderia phymatum]ACC72427.1 satase isoform II [Paraburkholderia phymatum STM815]
MSVTIKSTSRAIVEDFRCNAFFKAKFVILLFRIANYLARRSNVTLILGLPFIAFYILISDWVMGIEIPVKTNIGKGLTIYHGFGLVINGFSVIGDYCVLRHGVTIGNITRADGTLTGAPIVGNRVEFGANSIALGEIRIGDGARIGAGAVLLSSLAPHAVAVGVPARALEKDKT